MSVNGLKSLKPTLSFKQLNQIHAQIFILLKLLTQSSTPQNAIPLYNKMLSCPSSYNHYTFTQALKACSLAHPHQKALEIHAHVIEYGHLHDIFIQNSLLHFYVTVKDIFSAHQIFNSVVFPDVVSWTTIISGLSKCGFHKEAIDMFCGIDVKPNANTLVSVLSACSSLVSHKLGKAIHAHSLRNLNENNIILDNAILDFYIRCGSLASCGYLFVKMPKRNVVSWTTMIGGYAERGFCKEAVSVFQEMEKTKEAEPNEATLVNVLSACSSISALSFAIQVFNMLAYKDKISWSTVISGLAMNGCGRQALQLFSLMIINAVFPDDVTFIALISACSHGGLVDQGLILFKAMSTVYEIVPQMQHYACVVDMYGRAGLLEEAEAFFREMPIEAEWSVWGALLNACRIHRNDEMFDRIRQDLVNKKGVNVGTFALMSNTFAGADRWEDTNKIRDEIRRMGLKKKTGCSWIEVNPSIF
ncbi:pentatricopeptide repeat-containing protein At1g08070, chloroplastic-like [Citrus sinensis]|uniref:pentatricopeptide repeat-containing protein At1g08070, chloroplastic-like n=1 Tax=Citrus sinensis TaxID=2711 RepID=UPI0022794E7C|nr:pentatricopeptide repeat-containing protein At1g08070, chloroplastic-like [Citrus sinensis]